MSTLNSNHLAQSLEPIQTSVIAGVFSSSDNAIKNLFANHETKNSCYTGLTAVFNTVALLTAWSAKTQNLDIKQGAQIVTSLAMTYSILDGASQYQNAICYFILSYVCGLMNIWAYPLSQQLQISNNSSVPLCISLAVLSFGVTFFCDKPMRDCGLSIEEFIKEPVVFLRLWKNFWGKAMSGAFSMVGSNIYVSLFVEYLSFIQPIVFITVYTVLISKSNRHCLGWPKVDTLSNQLRLVPWCVMLIVASTIVFVGHELYFDVDPTFEGWLPILDILFLLVEATGMLLIQQESKVHVDGLDKLDPDPEDEERSRPLMRP